MTSLLGFGLPTQAQQTITTPVKPAAQVPNDQEITTVTVFGRLPKKPAAVSPTVKHLSRSSASSCAFSFTSFQDDIVDNYLDDVKGVKREGDEDTNPRQLGEDGEGMVTKEAEGFRDTSPNGDASKEAASQIQATTDSRVDPCGRSDRNFAAGRNYIARTDKTLTEAYAAYDAGNFPKALEIFKKSYSKLGYDEAALMLGNMYLYGQGTARDTKEAIVWYTKLAEARLVPEHYSPFDPKEPETASSRVQAQIKLARIYMTGFDVPKNPKEARRWYKAADDLNFIPARYVLGRMYHSGYGGEKNSKETVRLYTNASEYGYASAQFALASLYYYADGVPEDMGAAFEWYQQAAFNPKPDNKKPHAQLALAQMYDQGQGVKADPKKAFAFYKAAAFAGHPDAQNALGIYFYTGQIVEKNLGVARRLFSTAASQRQVDAMFNLSAMLLNGEGGDKDIVKAYVWLKLAGKLGHTQAPAAAAKLEGKLTPEQRAQADAVLSPKPAKAK